ncbi:hypothetical protein [Hymenobacter glacieicola]|uniref:Uncharacterized protein n=1 Tax=Hymenobacter glacieicola TaxID=1562124 RepID=A0ABQ1WMA0_9BACT|nr:hypothetical protein [Hymenobacter glacieicola]GGG34277.1 hypothetical protein GCM10011378_08370 [Hymenobacter glacieicola]
MPLKIRSELGRKLTATEVDDNFKYLESLAQANTAKRQIRIVFNPPGAGNAGVEHTQYFDAQIAGTYASLQVSGPITNLKITEVASAGVIFNGPPSSWTATTFSAALNTSYTFTLQVSDVTQGGSAIFNQ